MPKISQSNSQKIEIFKNFFPKTIFPQNISTEHVACVLTTAVEIFQSTSETNYLLQRKFCKKNQKDFVDTDNTVLITPAEKFSVKLTKNGNFRSFFQNTHPSK